MHTYTTCVHIETELPFWFQLIVHTYCQSKVNVFFALAHNIDRARVADSKKNEPSKIRRSSRNMRCSKNIFFEIFEANTKTVTN